MIKVIDGYREYYKQEVGDRVIASGKNEFGGLHGIDNGKKGTLIGIDTGPHGYGCVYTVRWDDGSVDEIESFFYSNYVRVDTEANPIRLVDNRGR